MRRTFQWTSSVAGDPATLRALDESMAAFYREQASRRRYQDMIDSESSSQPQTETALVQAIARRRPGATLEVGCGSGRLYRQLVAAGVTGAYAGLEMSADVIARNASRHSAAGWLCGSIYDADLRPETFDVVFAYFVLEHCVYPATALTRMVELLRPAGAVFLVFPDFIEMGRLASQTLGLVSDRAGALLKRGEWLNACVGLYDSRLRLPRALAGAVRRSGPFPVNLRPRCLTEAEAMSPDTDAVYIASKQEVGDWALRRGLRVSFPAGTAGHFRENALIAIEKPA